MALILATTYPDVFAAAGVHSATAYRSATQSLSALGAMAARRAVPSHGGIRGEMAPVVLIHGTDDRVVRPPNADRIVDQWLASRDASGPQGLEPGPTAGHHQGFRRRRPALHPDPLVHRPRPPGPRVLADRRARTRLVGWPVQGSFIDRSGPRAADVMWTFFHRHRLSVGFADPDDVVTDHDLAFQDGLRGVLDN